MKYAVPVAGGEVCPHFGHCEQFALYEVNEESKEITSKEFLTPPPHEPGVYPGWLAEQGVSFIIAGGMGSRAQNLFAENRIDVITGVMENDPEKAVISHLNGILEAGDNTCDH
jgi:ATP-binding protein involved in chromosome partitioning